MSGGGVVLHDPASAYDQVQNNSGIFTWIQNESTEQAF